MKLRIRGNSVRLRLTQGEMREFAGHGEVSDRVRFGPDAHLDYRLRSDPHIEAVTASWHDGALTVRMPARIAGPWCDSDEVSVRAVQATGDGNELTVLIEKDFACLKPRADEDESDMFPHPGAGRVRC